MLRGFWEGSSTNGVELTIHGWGYSDSNSVTRVLLRDNENEAEAVRFETFVREDVLANHSEAPLNSGLSAVFSVYDLARLDFKSSYLILEGSNGERCRVKPNDKDKIWASMCFSTYNEFARLIQNPAFRHPDPRVQTFGALLARNKVQSDDVTRAAGFVVILYKIISKHIDMESLIKVCMDSCIDEYEKFSVRSPLGYRWKISLGTAVGYFLLVQNRADKAGEVFADVATRVVDLHLWPAMATNIFTAHLIRGCLLASRPSGKQDAIKLLQGVPVYLQRSLGSAPLVNYYQYEEHVNAIRVAAQCAALWAALSDSTSWVGPRNVNIGILHHLPAAIAEILRKLLEES